MSNMPAGVPGHMPRRSSYAAVVSGAASIPLPAHHQPPRSGAFSHLLNQANEFGSDPYNQHGRSYRRSMDMDPNKHNGYSGGTSASWGANGQLPFHSRAYADLTNTYGYDGCGGVHFDHFFVPSYLKGSRYVQNLEAAYKAKIAAGREAQSRNSSQPGSLSTSSSSVNLSGKLAPSHRGMTYDLIEKSPPIENDGPQPLPSKWNTNDKYGGLEVLGDGYEVKVVASKPPSEREHEAFSIRADHPMPPQCGIYYFEVTIITRKRDDSIGVGFSTKEVPLSRPPGWEPNSWAYHGDDGRSFCCQSSGKDYGPTFSTNDVIGCGFNFRTSSAFFTKNGNPLGIAFREVKGKIFPSVGLKKPGEHVWVNFGQSPFVFDIDGLVLTEKKKLEMQIEATSTAKLAPPLDETSLIQSLVLQYLSHDGYVETARAFAQEVHTEKQALTLDPSVEVKEFDLEDDEDAIRRQQIRDAIMGGHIDNALNLTKTHYPKVLEDSENGVYFRLQCRKFVEMIRQAAEIRANLMNSKKSNGHDGDWYDDIINHDMELDSPAENNGFDKMDTDASPGTGQSDYSRLLEETINFGKLVQAEFAHDQRRETQRALRDAFALLAYEDPMNSPEVAYHLFPNRRLSIAEDLNSAILVSLGKSSSTALERLIKQTAVLTERLGRDGGPGSLINVYEYMKPPPPPRTF